MDTNTGGTTMLSRTEHLVVDRKAVRLEINEYRGGAEVIVHDGSGRGEYETRDFATLADAVAKFEHLLNVAANEFGYEVMVAVLNG
jgi:hypothetical protein